MLLLDTNICVRILRGDSEALAAYRRFKGNLAIPFMVVGELYYGADRSKNPERARMGVEKFISTLSVFESTQAIMSKFGSTKARLAAKGTLIEDADILIAAMALSMDMPLATGNVKHFERVQGLKISQWKEDQS